ncbi:hypothetical protein GCM10010341_59280 [Streptomyces noursei]|nr:hypothetical protein GCM10010341_59280 [Streptomyces noursei]
MQVAGLRDALAEGAVGRVAVPFDDRDRLDVAAEGGDGEHPGESAADHYRGPPAPGVLRHACPFSPTAGRRPRCRTRSVLRFSLSVRRSGVNGPFPTPTGSMTRPYNSPFASPSW